MYKEKEGVREEGEKGGGRGGEGGGERERDRAWSVMLRVKALHHIYCKGALLHPGTMLVGIKCFLLIS